MQTLKPSLASLWADDVYTVNNQKQYQDFVDATPQFSKENGDIERISATVGTRLINVEDNFAVCAKGNSDWKNDLFIIFRGSTSRNYGADWFANLRTGMSISSKGNPVHTGFNHIFSNMSGKLAQFVNSSPNAETIHCIGHSLGGAVANLCAEWAKKNYGKKTVKLYTFGAPRVGHGSLFATSLENSLQPENMYRVYHSNDPVPMIPVFPFMHSPLSNSGYYIPKAGKAFQFASHDMDLYMNSVGSHDWSTIYQPAPGLSQATIKQWLNDSTDENPHEITFWNRLNYAFSILAQGLLIIPGGAFSGAITVADYLAIILLKGIKFAGHLADWAFWIVRKIMRALGLKAIDKEEDVTRPLIQKILNQIMKYLEASVRQALNLIN